jgi:hypothetical protein
MIAKFFLAIQFFCATVLLMKYATHHETLGKAVQCVVDTLNSNEVMLAEPERISQPFEFDGIPYGQTKQAHAEIATIKGKKTRKFAHVSIYRMDSGTYELTLYIL